MGTVSTGEPGSQARVTNSGTAQNAVLDFTIPRGSDGVVQPSLLTLTHEEEQQPEAGGALRFDTEAVRAGRDLEPTMEYGQVSVLRSGLYQVAAHSHLRAAPGMRCAMTETLRLEQDGMEVPGGRVRQELSLLGEGHGVAFTVPVKVTRTPSVLRLTVDSGRSCVADLTFTVSRLGDWEG